MLSRIMLLIATIGLSWNNTGVCSFLLAALGWGVMWLMLECMEGIGLRAIVHKPIQIRQCDLISEAGL